ncbi:outer membrane beta-barrel protein [Phenylobacterium sp.]|jgi:hypothetical protein|uniref:outer membrane beta-barrel protein n=1 Tax=Phenylobacterium sp. TaxID=1871053 RepID=UPI002F423E7F
MLRIALSALIAAVPMAAAAQTAFNPAYSVQAYPPIPAAQVSDQNRRTLRLSQHLGAETESAGNPLTLSRGLEREAERDRRGSTFGVAYLPVAPKTDLFARVGYGGDTAGSVDSARNRTSFKFGAGAQYSPKAGEGYRADFTRQDFRNSRIKANVVSLGFVRRF